MQQVLSEAKKGQVFKLLSVDDEGLALKMLGFGFVQGVELKVIEKAPFGGDPMVVQHAFTKLILRKKDTACIKVELLNQ